MTDLVEVRRGAYYDSVSLMQVSKAVRGAAGVDAALVAMATDLNIELLAGMAFTIDQAVGPNDMFVAIRGENEAAIEAGRSALVDALAGLKAAGASAGGFGDAPPPRTLGSAIVRSGANLALISVPGANAFVEAMDAVTSGASVMLFSDNVSIEQEITLKDAAASAGVLVMGPDCGTAVVAGVALGFANLVRAGSVGLVAASGTGAQQVMCLLDLAGVGMRAEPQDQVQQQHSAGWVVALDGNPLEAQRRVDHRVRPALGQGVVTEVDDQVGRAAQVRAQGQLW